MKKCRPLLNVPHRKLFRLVGVLAAVGIFAVFTLYASHKAFKTASSPLRTSKERNPENVDPHEHGHNPVDNISPDLSPTSLSAVMEQLLTTTSPDTPKAAALVTELKLAKATEQIPLLLTRALREPPSTPRPHGRDDTPLSTQQPTTAEASSHDSRWTERLPVRTEPSGAGAGIATTPAPVTYPATAPVDATNNARAGSIAGSIAGAAASRPSESVSEPAWNQTHSRVIPLFPRRWWAVGTSTWSTSEVATLAAAPLSGEGAVLRWTPAAARAFAAHWRAAQHISPSGTCYNNFTGGDYATRTCAYYGLFSLVRDITTQFMTYVLRGVALTEDPSALNGCKQYCTSAEAQGSDTHTGCLFGSLTPCTPPSNVPAAETRGSSMFGLPLHNGDVPDVPSSLLAGWERAGDVWWESLDGQRQPQPGAHVPGPVVAQAKLTMMRCMLADSLLWRPRPAVLSLAAQLEHTLGLAGPPATRTRSDTIATAWPDSSLPRRARALHPMLVLMARRTDKSKDGGSYSMLRQRFRDRQVPIEMYGLMARAIENAAGVAFRSVFVLSDDIMVFRNRSSFLQHFRNGESGVVSLTNPYWEEIAPLLPSDWNQNSHDTLDITTAVPRFAFHQQLLVDMLVASRHGDFLLGCGLSAVHQMVVQMAGARAGVDPTWRTVWEEDILPDIVANVTKSSMPQRQRGSNTTSWRTRPNINAVFGMQPGDTITIVNDVFNATLCERACQQHKECSVWTWHAPDAWGGYALQCWLRLDEVFVAHEETQHVSGCSDHIFECNLSA